MAAAAGLTSTALEGVATAGGSNINHAVAAAAATAAAAAAAAVAASTAALPQNPDHFQLQQSSLDWDASSENAFARHPHIADDVVADLHRSASRIDRMANQRL